MKQVKLTKKQKECIKHHNIDLSLMINEISDGIIDIDDLISDVEECYEHTRGKYILNGINEDLVELSYILERVIKPQVKKNTKVNKICRSCGTKLKE